MFLILMVCFLCRMKVVKLVVEWKFFGSMLFRLVVISSVLVSSSIVFSLLVCCMACSSSICDGVVIVSLVIDGLVVCLLMRNLRILVDILRVFSSLSMVASCF